MRSIRVNEIYRAIQGEGKHTGEPCLIVRFQGCNKQCPFCDTPGSLDQEEGKDYTQDQLVQAVCDSMVKGFILLTGGEPALQLDTELVKALRQVGPLHVETNGSLPLPAGLDWVTVSPKGHVLPEVLEYCDELKWLVGTEGDVEMLHRFLAGVEFCGHVALQPVDQDPVATGIAYDACLKYGWQLSLQTHKLIGKR